MEQIRFGLIGCGFIGKVHAKIINSIPNARLTAVCNSSEGPGMELAEKYGCRYYKDYHEMVKSPEIDAVSICLPSGLHYEATLAAAQAGKHVMCEKPIAINVSDGEEMVAACKENNVKFGVIMQHNFDEPVLLLRKAIKDGILGRIIWGASRTIWYRDDKYFSNPRRGTLKYDGGGALITQSIHYIDLLLGVLGDVKSVSAKCRTLLHKQIETEDVGIATLEFTNGAIGTIEGTTTAYPGLYAELCVFGENGTVIIRNDKLQFYRFKSGIHEEFEKLLDPAKANELHLDATIDDSSHKKQFEDFINAIIEDREPLVTGEHALKSLKVIKAIYQSSDEKREIFL